MFYGICIFFVICDRIACSSSGYFWDSEEVFYQNMPSSTTREKVRNLINPNGSKIPSLKTPFYHRADTSRKRRQTAPIIDEDFNLPGQPVDEPKRESGNTAVEHENFDSFEESGTIFATELYTLMFSNGTLANLEMSSESVHHNKEPSEYTDIEGSGDDLIITSSTTKDPSSVISGSSSAATVTQAVLPTTVHDVTIPPSCMASTCKSNDDTVQIDQVVSEGTNLTLSCSVNASSDGIINWYKLFGESPILEAANERLDIYETKIDHSGTYMCIILTTEQCCHKTVNVKIYKVPNYRFQLTVIGSVAVSALLVCILLSICRNFRVKKYKKQLKKYKDGTEASFNLTV